MPGAGLTAAAISLISSLTTMCCAKTRCYRMLHSDGSASGGCGFTSHSLFDDPSTEVKVARANGVDFLYVGKGQGPPDEDE